MGGLNYIGMQNLEYLYMINHQDNRPYLERVMEKVGLDAKSKKRVGKYSMGMRQRLAIVQAIMENLDYLILDVKWSTVLIVYCVHSVQKEKKKSRRAWLW